MSGQTAPASDTPAAEVPAATETWVDGQATSDADYDDPKHRRPPEG